MKRTASKQQRGAVVKRKKRSDEPKDDAPFFLADDDEQLKAGGSEDEDEEQEETVEEKRLRLAKEYIQQLREVDDGDFVGVTGGDMEDEEGAGARDSLGDRLAKDAAEAVGRLQRKIASRVVVPAQTQEPSTSGQSSLYGLGRFHRCHRLPATAVALTTDDSTAFTVAKDGTIFSWDVETGKKTQLFRAGDKPSTGGSDRTADWVAKAARRASAMSLLTAAVSSDGRYLAVGGGDKRVHVFDAKSGQYIQEYTGHRDVVTGLVFREGSHQLLSCSLDRTVKIWSLDDRAYVDSLFGHQASALAVDMLRNERAVSAGQDRTCRVWKIPEESQLVFRPPTQAVDCCRYITSTEWVSGSSDGSLQVWSQMKKKPVSSVRMAHGLGSPYTGGTVSPGCVEGDCSGWVQSVAVCRGSDLVASGAGDGLIKLWQVEPHKEGGAQSLRFIGGLPARGFVNGLQIARSGRFLVAALGQEARMGRWSRDPKARNGLLIHSLELTDES